MTKARTVFRTTVLALAATVASCVAGYRLIYPSWSYRQKLTVELVVNGKPIEKSSVSEVTLARQPIVDVLKGDFVGEGVWIEVGDGRAIAVLLTNDRGAGWSFIDWITPIAPTRPDISENSSTPLMTYLGRQIRIEGERTFDVAYFSDASDPKSARLIDRSVYPNLAPNVVLGGMYLELTNEPVTRRIRSEVSWLPALEAKERETLTVHRYDRFEIHATHLVSE